MAKPSTACLLRRSRCLSPTPLLALEKGAEAVHEKRETRLLLRRSSFSPTKLLNPDFRAPFSLLLSMLDRGASRLEVSRHHQEALNLDAHSSIPPSSAANGIATEETSYTRSIPTLLFQKRLSVLNAKPENVEREAEIVAQSGRLGAVTISTNMAGRGTDIILGGNAEFMARLKLREVLMPRYPKLQSFSLKTGKKFQLLRTRFNKYMELLGEKYKLILGDDSIYVCCAS